MATNPENKLEVTVIGLGASCYGPGLPDCIHLSKTDRVPVCSYPKRTETVVVGIRPTCLPNSKSETIHRR